MSRICANYFLFLIPLWFLGRSKFDKTLFIIVHIKYLIITSNSIILQKPWSKEGAPSVAPHITVIVLTSIAFNCVIYDRER